MPRLQIGIEANLAAAEVGPILTGFLLGEGAVRPTVFVGTSSDRIGSPEGTQAYYATASKSLGRLPVTVYGTVNYSEWDAGWNVPFGGYVELAHGVTVQPMYDGERTHLLAHYARDRWSVSAIWAWLETPGVAVSFGF